MNRYTHTHMKDTHMRNARLLILGNALGQMWPIRAVIFLYFLNWGSTPGQYQLVQYAMFWLLLVIEIPTSWLSDRISRKGTLVAGSIFRFAGILLYAVGGSVWWFLAGELLLAVAKGLHSGTVQAMLKESLTEQGKADEYRKTSAWLDITGNAAQMVAVFAGGFIGMASLRATGVISAVMAGAALMVFLGVRDTHKATTAKEKRTLGGAFKDIGTAFKTVWSNPVLRTVSLCMGLVAAGSQLLYQLRQPFALDVGLPKEWFGTLETAALAIMIGGGYLARRAHPRHDKLWILLMGIVLFGGMLLAGALPREGSVLMVALLAIVCLIRGVSTFARPIGDDILQKEDIATQRATVLSVATFQGYALIAVGGPGVHWLVDNGYDAPSALACVGAAGAALYLLVLLTSGWFRASGPRQS
jgi:MFS family permease